MIYCRRLKWLANRSGADDQNRTGDLVLTKDALCQLSYIGLGIKPCGGGWSGRRGSNPRPTAWKAVTLPLSYSRRRARQLHCLALRRVHPPRFRTAFRRIRQRSLPPKPALLPGPPSSQLAIRSPPSRATRSVARYGGRRMVAREGLEPSKPLGRQIYSLLRLTASLPRQLSVVWKRDASGLT